jgi:hypothetical protein
MKALQQLLIHLRFSNLLRDEQTVRLGEFVDGSCQCSDPRGP